MAELAPHVLFAKIATIHKHADGLKEIKQPVQFHRVTVCAFQALWRLSPSANRCFEEDETMSRATYPLKLPNSVKKAAQRLAKEDGVSLNQWIAAAVAEKVGVIETAADFFKKRAGKAKGDGLMKFLRNAPRGAPGPEDQLR